MTPERDAVGPTILQLAAPLVVSFWMRAAVTFVDTIYAAWIGDSAVAAIGLTIPLEFLMIAVWVGLSTGLTSALSRAMGAREGSRLDQYVAIGWRLVWVVSPLFTVAGALLWVAAPYMELTDEVARSFQLYGTVLIGGSAFTTFWSIIPDSLIKAHQDTRTTMWAGIWSNVINVALNTLFLFAFGWGVLGIALSTVLGRIGGLVYALVRAAQHEARRRQEWGTSAGTTHDPKPYRAILDLAVPSSITFGLMATEAGLVNWLLSRSRHPTEAIAAYSLHYRLVLFALQPVIATSVAMLPFAARRVGALDWGGVRHGFRQATLATSVYSLAIVGPIMYFLAPWLAHRLTESPITTSYAIFALRMVPLACFASIGFLLVRPVFEAMQRGRPGLVMAVLRYLVLTPPLAWGGLRLADGFDLSGLHGLIAGTLAAAALASGAFYVWLLTALPGTVPARASARRSPRPG